MVRPFPIAMLWSIMGQSDGSRGRSINICIGFGIHQKLSWFQAIKQNIPSTSLKYSKNHWKSMCLDVKIFETKVLMNLSIL